jgi:hypothetical protein
MRIAPNHPRLRAIAIGCWAIGAWWIIEIGLLSPALFSPFIAILMVIAGVLLFTVGVSFWVLSGDRRAGIVFDSKGLLLNLGNSASFVSWDNIEHMESVSSRGTWLALGSASQVGIRLRNPTPYLQSYETRLPATLGLIGHSIQLVRRVIAPFQAEREPTSSDLAHIRARTGYDILIPEALLGGSSQAFIDLAARYRSTLYRR